MKMQRMYSLFRKEGKRWVRLSTLAFRKETAIRVFQNALLNGSFAGQTMGLRPVKPEVSALS